MRTELSNRSVGRSSADALIELAHIIRNIDDDTYFYEIRFKTIGPCQGKIVLPRSMAAKLAQIKDELLDRGADDIFKTKTGRKLIEEALDGPPSHGRIMETGRTGWHGDSFVTEGETYGPKRRKLRFQGGGITDQETRERGTLKAWKFGLQIPCEHSDFLLFAIGIGFAAPFLELVSPNGGATFYLWGSSTTGKTLAQRVLVSISRRALENDLMTFDHTERKLEEEAAAYNGQVMVLNEGEHLEDAPESRAARMRQIAYTVAGGVGRQRSKAATSNPDLKNKTWVIFCLGSGETTAKNPLRKKGEEIRLIDLPVPEPHLGGMFDVHGPDVNDPRRASAKLAKAVEQTITDNYGVALGPFMEAICADREATIARVKRNMALFMRNVAATADPRARRMVEKFAIVYAGAIEACRFGVAPWTEQRARDAIAHVCRVALRRIEGDSASVENAIKRLRETVRDPKRFPKIERGDELRPELAEIATGFRRSDARGEFVAIWPEDLGNLVGGDGVVAHVLARLADEKILLPDSDGKLTRKVQVGGFGERRRGRWYCFRYVDLIRRCRAEASL